MGRALAWYARKLGLHLELYNLTGKLSTLEVEAEGSKVQSQPGLHSKFKNSLGYVETLPKEGRGGQEVGWRDGRKKGRRKRERDHMNESHDHTLSPWSFTGTSPTFIFRSPALNVYLLKNSPLTGCPY